jgi:hypothetical protein
LKRGSADQKTRGEHRKLFHEVDPSRFLLGGNLASRRGA